MQWYMANDKMYDLMCIKNCSYGNFRYYYYYFFLYIYIIFFSFLACLRTVPFGIGELLHDICHLGKSFKWYTNCFLIATCSGCCCCCNDIYYDYVSVRICWVGNVFLFFYRHLEPEMHDAAAFNCFQLIFNLIFFPSYLFSLAQTYIYLWFDTFRIWVFSVLTKPVLLHWHHMLCELCVCEPMESICSSQRHWLHKSDSLQRELLELCCAPIIGVHSLGFLSLYLYILQIHLSDVFARQFHNFSLISF